jgi:ADP-heptose:LPS heptosyltransferase
MNDIGSPNLGFSVYNPTNTIVYGFTKNQLQILTNLMWTSNSLGIIFKTMILISRLDISLLVVISGEITSIFVIRYLLNNKKDFIPDFDSKEEFKLNDIFNSGSE